MIRKVQRFQELGAQTVYHTKKESFFFLRNVELNEKKMPYVVFFRSFNADQKDIDVIVKVSSAYTKPSMTRYASPVKFHRMIAARAKNRKLPLGPAKQIKRG